MTTTVPQHENLRIHKKNGDLNDSSFPFKVAVLLVLWTPPYPTLPRSRAISHDHTSYSRRTALTGDRDNIPPLRFQPQTPSADPCPHPFCRDQGWCSLTPIYTVISRDLARSSTTTNDRETQRVSCGPPPPQDSTPNTFS